ncbi:hypothetical protein N0V88_004116 [Collariella sp. IMI 366227]|nr:hypothetical protein N0V88_004116 [Collariella sp. IMI 366227]
MTFSSSSLHTSPHGPAFSAVPSLIDGTLLSRAKTYHCYFSAGTFLDAANYAWQNLVAELRDVADHPPDWPSTFAEVARRYYHLNRAKARVVEKLETAQNARDNGSVFSFCGVAPWNRFLRLNDKTSEFHYPDPVWSYSQEDGVLVYPTTIGADGGLSSGWCEGHGYHVLDLSSVRLAQGVLIIEWAEEMPYHQLNDREVVHRHFVTAFDVIRKPALTAPEQTWTVKFRSEWKLHFLGLPLNRSDRFFSAHTTTHYAVYFWQPNRSLYQDDPIEQLAAALYLPNAVFANRIVAWSERHGG